MANETKHIEQLPAEEVLSSVITAAVNDQTMGEIITKALAMLFAQATGIQPPSSQPIMVQPPEIVSVMVLLLRKSFTTPYEAFGGSSLVELIRHSHNVDVNVQDTYAWLINRMAKTYLPSPELPYDRDAAHLIRNMEAGIGNRRISNGDTTPDGVSILRWFWKYRPNIKEIIDDNTEPWTYSRGLTVGIFINQSNYRTQYVRKVLIAANSINASLGEGLYNNYPNAKVYVTNAKTVPTNLWRYDTSDDTSYPSGEGAPITSNIYRSGGFCSSSIYIEKATDSAVTTVANGAPFASFRYIYLYAFERGYLRLGGAHANNYDHNPTTYIYVGCKGEKSDTIHLYCHTTINTTITDIEIGEGACQNLTIQNINGLTAENMYNHILCHLKQDEAGCGAGVVISLGETNMQKLIDAGYDGELDRLAEDYGYTFTDYPTQTE